MAEREADYLNSLYELEQQQLALEDEQIKEERRSGLPEMPTSDDWENDNAW